jgi:hypothetical protein
MLRRDGEQSHHEKGSHPVALSRSKVNSALSKLLAKRPRPLTAIGTLDQFEAALPSSTDDRGMALVSSAIIEQLVEEAVLSYCTKKFEKDWRQRLFGSGPDGQAVQGFYGKIMLGHALGIYNTAFFEDLDRIRRIRNVFAHARMPLTFKSKSLQDACAFHVLDPRLTDFGKAERSRGSPQKAFLAAVSLMSIVLYTLANKNRRYRPRAKKNKSWVYAEPLPLPDKPTKLNRRRQRSVDQRSAPPAHPP